MADPVFYLYAVAAGAVFLLIGLEERPWAFNVKRVARRVRRNARRRGTTTDAAMDLLAKNTRRGGWVLAGFGMASGLLVVVDRARPAVSTDYATDDAFTVFGLTLSAGLLFLAFAFLQWAPRLFERVREELAREGNG